MHERRLHIYPLALGPANRGHSSNLAAQQPVRVLLLAPVVVRLAADMLHKVQIILLLCGKVA